MNLIDNKLLDKVSKQAKESDRLRMNFNFHESLEAPAQRLLNALEPGTILAIHRHEDTDETYLILRGELDVIYYDNSKREVSRTRLDPNTGNYGIHIPKGQWHTVEVLTPNTVIFEVKDGPYMPLSKDNLLL